MATHTHNMQPMGVMHSSVFMCASCVFRCTKRSVTFIRNNPRMHHVVRRGTPEAEVVWDVLTGR